MEEASCQARCAGLFRRPLEVFLLACNTLATKDEDARTPEQYLQVLLDHDFDRAAAERVVELRYGPLGPSFRESLRRIFAGVPRIYGFSSVAPRGEYTAPMLARYLRATPDYAAALRIRRATRRRNRALLSAFKGTSLTQTVGLTPTEPGAIDRTHICALYDETRPLAERLRIAYGLLVRPDALRFVPTVEVFLSRHPSEQFSPVERSIFAEIQHLDAARHDVLEIVRQLDVSALKLELAHFAVLVGWLDQDEFHAMAVDAAHQLLEQHLSAEVVDIMCAITKHESLRADFDADDISAVGLRRSAGAPAAVVPGAVRPARQPARRGGAAQHRSGPARVGRVHPHAAPTERRGGARPTRAVPARPLAGGRRTDPLAVPGPGPPAVRRGAGDRRVDPALLRERATQRPESRLAALFDW